MRFWQMTAFLLAAWLLLAIPVSAQNISTDKVTIGLKDADLQTAIRSIEQQSVFRFFYHNEDIKTVTHLNLPEASRTIGQTLTLLLQNTPLSFRQMDKNILLERKQNGIASDIRGRVVTPVDGEPVDGASVFLSNATIGDKTGIDGSFLLKNVKPGKYVLIVSNVGYDTYQQDITVEGKSIDVPPVTLSPQTVMLTEVNVHAKTEPDRERNFAIFSGEFLGSSKRAAECKILNPQLLDFNYNNAANILTASSEDFLEIDNNALGYKLKYQVTNFVKNMVNTGGNDVQFGGPAVFREMNGGPGQRKRWQKARLDAYEGSMMHFLRSLLNNSFEQEGFRVLKIGLSDNPLRPADSVINRKIALYAGLAKKKRAYKDSLKSWQNRQLQPVILKTLQTEPLKQVGIVRLTNQKGVFALSGDKCALYIEYSKAHHFTKPRIDNLDAAGNDNRTVINFDAPFILFDKNGTVMDPNCVSFEGAWGRDRVGDLLPVDYDPDELVMRQADPPPSNNTNFASPINAPRDLKEGLIRFTKKFDTLAYDYPPETVYLQWDKPYYACNDTLWFKGYLLNAASLAGSDKSGVLYVDITNDRNQVVHSYAFPVLNARVLGNIALNEKNFSAGTYTLRAYTNWMRNFGDRYFFYKTFAIATAGDGNWLIDNQLLTDSLNTRLTLKFSDIKRQPLSKTNLSIQATDGGKRIFRQVLQTDTAGLINFVIPNKNYYNGWVLTAVDEKEAASVKFPVILNRCINADVQFLPEGGSLVAGLPARIGVKAVGEDGKGLPVSGTVTDSEQNTVAEFSTFHAGIGSFGFLALSEGVYTANVKFPDGSVRQYRLPPAVSSGTLLQVHNTAKADSLLVSVGASYDVAKTGRSFYLVAHSRGRICYAAVIDFRQSNFIRGMLAKSLFPTGVVHFTLMTLDGRPLNERLFFVGHDDLPLVQFSYSKSTYYPADSVALIIKVTDGKGKPLRGSFSLAVTDRQQVKTDSLEENILSHSFLSTEVRGVIEEPGYYLAGQTPERLEALDNLLLTQGWIGYTWGDNFKKPELKYAPESGFVIRGNVVGPFSKPLKGTHVTLFNRSPLILIDTLTNDKGEFVFDNFPRVDTPIFIIKAVNKKGNSNNIGITIAENDLPVFNAPRAYWTPWNVNPDTTLLRYAKNTLVRQQSYYNRDGGELLKEVKITGQKTIKGSKNRFGEPDFVVNENELVAADKKSWLQVLADHLRGFREGYFPHTIIQWYFMNDKAVFVFVDGVSLSSLFPQMTFMDMRDYLQTHFAEDIRGIEVVSRYRGDDAYAFVEMTTRAGQGPIINNTPGLTLYKPLALTWPKLFYKPMYTIASNSKQWLSDLRSTIDWEPEIQTDANGEATIHFYTAGRASTYLLKLEGTDFQGNFVFKTGEMTVEPAVDEKKNGLSK